MAEHEHGSMNSDGHQKTFDGFMKFVTRAVIVIIAILLLMALFAR
jgi:hypothetical protein